MQPLLCKGYLTRSIWANDRLAKKRGLDQPIGTFWDVSIHDHVPTTIQNVEGPPYLKDLIHQDLEGLLGPGLDTKDFIQCVYLDAKDQLSIQVHPDDAYAQKHANDNGKFETWYIMDAKPGATLVGGTTTTDANIIKKELLSGEIKPYLKQWTVHTGDYSIIPNGTLHALGSGILALEIGTNSDTTYRFYDYDRVDAQGKKRPLQIEDSFQVAHFENTIGFIPAHDTSCRLCEDPFIVDDIYVTNHQKIMCGPAFCIITNVTDSDILYTWKEDTQTLPAYDSLFVPYSAEELTLHTGHVLVSRPKRG